MFSGRTVSRALRKRRPSAPKGKRTVNKGTSPNTGSVPFPRFPWGKYNLDLNEPGLLAYQAKQLRRLFKGSKA